MKDYIIRNIKEKRKDKYIHEYTDKRGNKLSKKDYEHLLNNLYIAPAYDNVKINKHKKDKVLDLCCNVGRHLNALNKIGYSNLFGVDINNQAIQKMTTIYNIKIWI